MTNNRNQPSYPPPFHAWYTVAVLLLAYLFSILDRQILTLLVVPIQEDLQVSDTLIGLLHGFTFALFYALMGLPIARLVDSGNRRMIVGIGIFLWSLATSLCGVAQQYWHLLLARVGVAVGEAALLPGASSLLADYFPPKQRGRAMGVFATGVYLGGGLALLAGGALVGVLEEMEITLPWVGTLRTWQAVFIAVGVPGILVALLMATIKEPGRHGVTTVKSIPLNKVIVYLKANRRSYACVMLGMGCYGMVVYAFATWIPTLFVRQFGWSYYDIGLAFGAILLVFGPAGTICGGWLADWWQQRHITDAKMRVGVVAAIGVIPWGVLAPLIPNPFWALACLVPFSFFSSLLFGTAPAAIQDMTPNLLRGQATALYTGVLNLVGAGLGPVGVGLLTDYVFGNPQDMKYSMVIVLLVAGTLSCALFLGGLKPYRESLRYTEKWSSQTVS